MDNLQSDLSKLLQLLYQAPGDEIAWARFIETFSRTTGATQGLFVHHDMVNQHTSLSSAFNLDEKFATSYEAYYQFNNPYITATPSALPKQGTFGLLNELIPDKEVEKTEFFHDYVTPQDLTVCNAIRITPFQSDEIHSTIALHYPRNNGGDHVRKALKICEFALPHLQTALQLHKKICGLNARLNHLTGAFDKMPLGMIILDGSARPIEVNDAANHLLLENDGLCISKNKFYTHLSRETACLNRVISSALKMAQGEPRAGSGSFQVQRPSGKRPYQLYVTPIYEQTDTHLGSDCAVGIFVCDPESTPESLELILHQLYGLTNTEAKVTKLLIQGYAGNEITELLSIQRETLKTHLKHIFQKTDTRRQSELVSAILRGPARLSRML